MGHGRRTGQHRETPLSFCPIFIKCKFSTSCSLCGGGARGQGRRRAAEPGKATSLLSLTWARPPPPIPVGPQEEPRGGGDRGRVRPASFLARGRPETPPTASGRGCSPGAVASHPTAQTQGTAAGRSRGIRASPRKGERSESAAPHVLPRPGKARGASPPGPPSPPGSRTLIVSGRAEGPRPQASPPQLEKPGRGVLGPGDSRARGAEGQTERAGERVLGGWGGQEGGERDWARGARNGPAQRSGKAGIGRGVLRLLRTGPRGLSRF